MKKSVFTATLLILLAGSSAYFYFSRREYVVRITETQIREKLESKLPITKHYFTIVELTLNNPRVALKNGTSRVTAGLDATLNITALPNPKPLAGTIDVSSGINYLAETGQFFLSNPKIEDLQIQGIPQILQTKVLEALSKALTEYFQKNPIYTLRNNVKQAAVRMVLKSVKIENQELVITLGI